MQSGHSRVPWRKAGATRNGEVSGRSAAEAQRREPTRAWASRAAALTNEAVPGYLGDSFLLFFRGRSRGAGPAPQPPNRVLRTGDGGTGARDEAGPCRAVAPPSLPSSPQCRHPEPLARGTPAGSRQRTSLPVVYGIRRIRHPDPSRRRISAPSVRVTPGSPSGRSGQGLHRGISCESHG